MKRNVLCSDNFYKKKATHYSVPSGLFGTRLPFRELGVLHDLAISRE